jgi:serine/threonine-protein kinase RsbW
MSGESGMHPLQGGARRVELRIDSRLDHVELLGHAVRALCATVGVPARECAQVELALFEAVNNVIRHAYRGQAGHPVDVVFTVRGERFSIEIEDEGEAMPPPKEPVLEFDPDDIANLPEGGMGLFLIHSVMDEVAFARKDGRNSMRMTRRLAA